MYLLLLLGSLEVSMGANFTFLDHWGPGLELHVSTWGVGTFDTLRTEGDFHLVL